jgi:dinuclear metal center YbgI/SA1388 family protein
MQSVERNTLERDLIELLESQPMSDYCPNGLQVEGKSVIRRVITGVTASQALIDVAVARQADAILVHHGLMWKGDPQVLRGFRKSRMQTVLAHDLNVFAYHLPLDKHSELGNNVCLGKMLGWPTDRVTGDKGLVHVGLLPQPLPLGNVVQHVQQALGHRVLLQGADDLSRPIRTVSWCTGGAPGYVESAALAGADLYLTGELSEPSVHVAKECGVSLLGAGHHATERGGIQALGQWVAQRYGIAVEFHDLFVSV